MVVYEINKGKLLLLTVDSQIITIENIDGVESVRFSKIWGVKKQFDLVSVVSGNGKIIERLFIIGF